jgi:hypothetical protein
MVREPAGCNHVTVTGDPLLERARHMWIGLAGTAVAFKAGAVDVAASRRSLLCPPGWVGIVSLGDAVIASAPDDHLAGIVRRALGGLTPTAMTDPAVVHDVLPIGEVLGPATLAYCDRSRFRPANSDAVEAIPAGHTDLMGLLSRVPADDAEECGLADITSRAFVARSGAEVIAAAGYQLWPGDAAHIGVLTAPADRGRGLAGVVATAAAADALESGLLPQWRARIPASRRVAQRLGFQELGRQFSIRLVSDPRADDAAAPGTAPGQA